MASNTEILQQLAVSVPRIEAKIDKLLASVDAIAAAGTSPKDAVKQALKDIVSG